MGVISGKVVNDDYFYVQLVDFHYIFFLQVCKVQTWPQATQ